MGAYVSKLDRQIARQEESEAWQRAHRLSLRLLYGSKYERPVGEAAAKELQALVTRRLRQIGGDAA